MRGALVIWSLVAGCWSLVGGFAIAQTGTPATAQARTDKQAAARWQITDPGQGPFTLGKGNTAARELSGVTWAGGNRYYAVSDKLGRLFPLVIDLDMQSGVIKHAALEPHIELAASKDLEGVAYDAEHGTVIVSDESGPGVRECRVSDGRLVRSARLPAIYSSARNNLSLESMSMAPDDRTVWTVNEEALTVDGSLASFAQGSVIRLLRLDRNLEPTAQYAYPTDALVGDMLGRGRDIESSGVSDLVALPGGALLVLERAYGARGQRIRLYEVDFTGATDISRLPSLENARYTPVRRTMLWQQAFPNLNYEGVALGPQLENGSRSLVLISDDGHSQRQALYALTIRPRGS